MAIGTVAIVWPAQRVRLIGPHGVAVIARNPVVGVLRVKEGNRIPADRLSNAVQAGRLLEISGVTGLTGRVRKGLALPGRGVFSSSTMVRMAVEARQIPSEVV
jgi:hypothetical protein